MKNAYSIECMYYKMLVIKEKAEKGSQWNSQDIYKALLLVTTSTNMCDEMLKGFFFAFIHCLKRN